MKEYKGLKEFKEELMQACSCPSKIINSLQPTGASMLFEKNLKTFEQYEKENNK